MTKTWISLAILVLLSGTPPAISASSRSLTGHDLPILRNYFLRQYVETVIAMRSGGGFMTRGDMILMNQRVSEWIDDYLIELSGRLRNLQTEFRAGQRFRDFALNDSSDSMNRSAAQVQWRRSLEAVEDQADEIRGMLRRVLRGMQSRNKFKPVISDGSENAGFQGEMAFLDEQIGMASRRIRDYFFAPTHIVSVNGLRGENMMIYLYRVQKMSESLRKRIGRG